MSQQRLRPLGFGEILDGAFTLYRHNFPTLFTTTLLAVIPITLLTRSIESASLAVGAGSTIDPATLGAVLVAVPATGLLWALLWGALTQQTAEMYEGRGGSLLAGYARAARALPTFIGAGIGIAVLGVLLVMAIAIALVLVSLPLTLIGSSGWIGTVYGGLASFAGMVAALAAMTSIFAVVPAIIVEGHGPWASLRRSHQLARGARARIVAILLVSSLIVLLPTIGLAVAAGMGAALWDVAAAATLSSMQLFLQQFIMIVASALTTPFMVACMTLLYFDRRVRLEGYDLEIAAERLAAHAID